MGLIISAAGNFIWFKLQQDSYVSLIPNSQNPTNMQTENTNYTDIILNFWAEFSQQLSLGNIFSLQNMWAAQQKSILVQYNSAQSFTP